VSDAESLHNERCCSNSCESLIRLSKLSFNTFNLVYGLVIHFPLTNHHHHHHHHPRISSRRKSSNKTSGPLTMTRITVSALKGDFTVFLHWSKSRCCWRWLSLSQYFLARNFMRFMFSAPNLPFKSVETYYRRNWTVGFVSISGETDWQRKPVSKECFVCVFPVYNTTLDTNSADAAAPSRSLWPYLCVVA